MNKDYIEIKGARVNNLKNISINIPTEKLIVITGLSGSGKSSLAFDTLFAEGQRRYVESLSSYARQFLGRINKPDVDEIAHISPAIAIEQKVITSNARSTVGTMTEIYDYMKLLFARIGITYSPISGDVVKRSTVTDVVEFITNQLVGSNIFISIPTICDENIIEKMLDYMSSGYERVYINGEFKFITEFMPEISIYKDKTIYLIIERLNISDSDDITLRIADSVGDAFDKGNGKCVVFTANEIGGYNLKEFSTFFEADGMYFEHPTEQMFNFNSPYGACPKCEGFGRTVGIDETLVIPDTTKSLYSGAVACWKGESMGWWRKQIIDSAELSGFPIHRPYEELTDRERNDLWHGNKHFMGIDQFFEFLEKEKYKVQYRVLISRYSGKCTCSECKGGRLKKEASYVKVSGYTIMELSKMPIKKLLNVMKNLELSPSDSATSERILEEIVNRVTYLLEVGLGYLTLDRVSSTLSGGESQRINLSTSLGSSLVGSMYILDEPSIGLHPRDTHRLIGVLKQLRDIGNTVIVVEHEEEIMRAADEIIDIGPYAGPNGGEVVFQGTINELVKASNSLTADYICQRREVTLNDKPRSWKDYIEIIGARANNLKKIDVKFPLGVITCITGVSGSGKSSLVKEVLYPALHRYYVAESKEGFNNCNLTGGLSLLKGVEMIDQSALGRSSRSNPATYIKVYDDIRKLYASLPYAESMGYTPSSFSFNIAGGRCEECQGEGVIRVEMQFMADIVMKCEVCDGKRFKNEILQVQYRDKNISDILDMSVEEAIEFFSGDNNNISKKIVEKLSVLAAVGLGYIKLGQSSSTLSGGESQRVKLAFYLLKENSTQRTMFIFDEPTTGLHFHDIQKLLIAIDSLVKRGHTAVIVEHNMDVIRLCDWVIDLGPDGGEDGGYKVFEGTPQQLAKNKNSFTGIFLNRALDRK